MRIILLVGPSGSGKDSLLRAARKHFAEEQRFNFVRRYITRPPDSNEDNYYLDQQAFNLLRLSGFFISSWQAHGNQYGIAHHLLPDATAEATCLCSVSRRAIADFEAQFTEITTVLVTVSEDILRRRLFDRGRESKEDVRLRLERANMPVTADNLIHFDNSAPLAESVNGFIALIEEVSGLTLSQNIRV